MSKTYHIQSLERNSFIKPYSHKPRTQIQPNIDKSLIAELPESMDLGERLRQKDMEIQRLTHALDFYRNSQKTAQKSINPFDFYLNSDKKHTPVNNMNLKLEEYLFDTQIKELLQNASKAHSLSIQNHELKQQLKQLREGIIDLQEVKNTGSSSQKEINRKIKDSQIEVNRLKSQIWSLQAEIGKLNYENTELRKALNSITKIKLGDESQSVLRVIQQSSEFPRLESGSSGVESKVTQMRQQLESKQHECEQLRQKTIELESKLFKISQEVNMRDNNLSPSKKRSPSHSFSSHQKRATILNSISEFEVIDMQRYQLKMIQKNKQYEQLYGKYQRVESEKQTLEDQNEQLLRETKFLADRLSEIEVLQEGDEVVGEMENKLVLMSTELMRLGNLNRHKVKQSQQFSIQLKQTIHKLQLSTKDNIEKDKIILNYKQQLTLIQQKMHEKTLLDDYDQQTLEEYKEELLQKDKEMARLRYLNRELEEDGKTYELKVRVFEEKVIRLEQENREMEKEVKEMEKSVLAQSSVKHFNLELELERYKAQCQSLQQQIKAVQQKLATQRSLLHQAQSQKSLLISQRQSYQERLSSLQIKAKKSQFRIQQKEQQLREMKHSYQEKLIVKNEQTRKISEKLTILQRNAESLMKSPRNNMTHQSTENVHRIQEENMMLKIEISKYEQKAAKMEMQMERLNILLDNYSHQSHSLASLQATFKEKDKQLRESRRQVESLANKVKRLQEEKGFIQSRNLQTIEEMRKLQAVEGEYRRLKNEYEITVHQLGIKQDQVGSLTKRLQASGATSPRSYSSEQALTKYNTQIALLKTQHNNQIHKYTQQISSLQIQLQACHSQLSSLQHIHSQDNLHEQLSQQIIRLNTVLSERIGEVVVLQKELELAQHKVMKCEQLLANQRHSKLKQATSFISQNSAVDNPHQTSLLKNQQKQILLLTERLHSAKQTNRGLQQKLDHIISQKIKLQHRLSQLQYLKGERSMVYHQNESHLTSLISEIKVSNQRLEQTIQQIERHYIDRLQEKQACLKKVQHQALQDKAAFQRQLYQVQGDYRRLQAQNRQKDSLLMQNQQSSIMHESQHNNILKIKQEYEVKLVLISQQLERCKLLKDQKCEQFQALRNKFAHIQQAKKDLIIQNQSNKNTVDILSQQIQRLSIVLSSNIDQIRRSDKEINRLLMKIQELHSQIRTLKSARQQIPSPHQQPSVPEHEYESLNQQYITAKNNLFSAEQQLTHLQQQLNEHQHKIQSQRKEHADLQEHYNRLTREKRTLNQQKDALETKVRQVKRNEEHLRELLNEELRKKQLSDIELFEKRSQIQQYKSRQREENTLALLRDEIRVLKQSNNSLQAKFQLILTENQKLVYQVQNFKRSKSNSVSSNKNESANARNLQLQELNQVKSQNQLLKKEINQLEQRIVENNKFRGQVQAYQEQVHQLQAKLKRNSNQKSNLLEQLNKLQQEHKQKCQQVRRLNQKVNEVEDEVHNSRSKGQRLNQQIVTCKRDKKQLIQKIEALQKAYHNQSQTSSDNSQNAGRIKAEYYTKTIKMTSIDEVDQKQQRSRGPSAHQNKHHQQHGQVNGQSSSSTLSKQMLQKYQLLQVVNAKLKKENECYRKKSIEYEFKMNKLKQQFDLLSKLINEYRDENDKLKHHIANSSVNINSQQQKGVYVITGDRKAFSVEQTTQVKSPLPSNQTLPHNNYSHTRIAHNRMQDKFTSHERSGNNNSANLPINNSTNLLINNNNTSLHINNHSTNLPINNNTNLPSTKNGSSVTFRPMNLNEYHELKESMHHIQNQIQHSMHSQGSKSNTNINLDSYAPNPMVTLPIDQIHMLINQIDRLLVENKTFLQELNDHKVMLIKHESSKARYEQNLATIVIMVVEIEALRHRVAVAQAERQQLRRQSFSPTKSNR